MASYCTRVDLEARVGSTVLVRIADLEGQGVENSMAIDAAISDIDGIVTGSIVDVWPTYVGVSTPLLRAIAVDLTIDRLAQGPTTSVDIQRAGDLARDLLASVAKGDIRPDADATKLDGGGSAEIVTGRRVFSGGGY